MEYLLLLGGPILKHITANIVTLSNELSCRGISNKGSFPIISELIIYRIPYFFSYKMEFFFFQNNPKDLDLSCKTDLDLWDCLGRVNLYYSKISWN